MIRSTEYIRFSIKLIGDIGFFIGGWVFSLLGLSVGGLIGEIVAAFVGAVILLTIFNYFKRRK